ncbi:hypothetical protein RM543_13415 [Roseicyclus sp. F158]|uniref:Uncharacterized protein n=1 Tax=Tropicimonas omnivorans TaxID=3075590 RepID=A0ABU3DIZ2_9RHOB|nr:hypothetical protein [Roseicyclus sp. F158]MDT0683686.1 hypothetical protein [Roseicyclus sp. F158]
MSYASDLGGWLAGLSLRELHQEGATFRKAVIAELGGADASALDDTRLAQAVQVWLAAPRAEYDPFPPMPAEEASEMGTDMRLYLEHHTAGGGTPASLSVDEYAGALRMMRRILLGEMGSPEAGTGPVKGLKADFKLGPK